MTLSYLYSKVIKKLHGRSVLNCNIANSSVICASCNIVNCNVGKYSYIGHDSQCVNSEIGAFCSISDHVFIGGAEHPMEWVSTSPVFENVSGGTVKKRFVRYDVPKISRTIVGNDVWIGHGVTIKGGVTIGDGAVIGSGAVITKDVPPYAIVGGVPAKVIRYRFDNDIIIRFLNTKWWEFDDNVIEKLSEYIKEPLIFLDMLEKYIVDKGCTNDYKNDDRIAENKCVKDFLGGSI